MGGGRKLGSGVACGVIGALAGGRAAMGPKLKNLQPLRLRAGQRALPGPSKDADSVFNEREVLVSFIHRHLSLFWKVSELA